MKPMLPTQEFEAVLLADELEERVEFCECAWGDPGGDGCCIDDLGDVADLFWPF